MSQKPLYNQPVVVRDILDICTIKNFQIDLVGSSAQYSYFGDYDAYSKIKYLDKNEMYGQIARIIDETDKDDRMYFIELKLQKSDDDKLKFNSDNDIERHQFYNYYNEDVQFIKFDYILWVEEFEAFKAFSVMYDIKGEQQSFTEKLQSLSEDIKDLSKEGKYFKILKRLLSQNKLFENYEKKLKNIEQVKNILKFKPKKVPLIFDFVNGPIGRAYVVKSNLEDIMMLIDNRYTDNITNKRMITNLSKFNIPLDKSKIESNIKILDKKVNSEAKKFINENHI